MSKQKRVLILAEAANPDWTSVPLIGWLHTKALSKRCSVHLVTHVRNKAAIEKQGWIEGQDFTAINTENIAAPMNWLARFLRGGRSLAWTIDTALASFVYIYFEWKVWKKFRSELELGEYDVVHRITPVSPTSPSIISKRLKKIGVPFVVGPLNGGVPWPKEFIEIRGQEKEWLNRFREFYKLLPGYRSMRETASAIIVGSEATKEQMQVKNKSKVIYIAENAVDTDRFNLSNTSNYSLPLKAVFVGRLVPYKGADMAIEAMLPFLREGSIEYHIYGDGPEKVRLENLIDEFQVSESVYIHGFVGHEELQSHLADADLLVFPSIREFGGGVVLEAMAIGLVPVVADYAGPAELVTKECGYTVPISKRAEFIKDIRATINEIVKSPEDLVYKREASRSRIEAEYTWEKKVEQVIKIYNLVISQSTEIP